MLASEMGNIFCPRFFFGRLKGETDDVFVPLWTVIDFLYKPPKNEYYLLIIQVYLIFLLISIRNFCLIY